MDISTAKDKIKEIYRRSSIKNYFSPFVPKRQKYRAYRHKSDKGSVLDSQKLALNLLVQPKRPIKLLPLGNEISLKNKKFIQLSSKQLEFPETYVRKGLSKSYLFKEISTFRLPYIHQSELKDHKSCLHSSQVPIKFELTKSPAQATETKLEKDPLKDLKKSKKTFSFIDIKKIKNRDTAQNPLKLPNLCEKFISVGENTEFSQLIPWEDENFPAISFY